MSTFVDTAPLTSSAARTSSLSAIAATAEVDASLANPPKTDSSVSRKGSFLVSIFTTSACLHLLIIGLTGYGGPKSLARHLIHKEAPPPPIIENVHIEEAPPPPQHPKETLNQPPPAEDLTAPAAVASIAAVAANVAVDFAVRVAGPVNLVSTAAETTEVLAPPSIVPREVTGRDLLTPELAYPPVARYKHLTGHVVVEFRTTATGDIVDVKVRSSSGHPDLDEAAVSNLRLGRWIGEAGYFIKSYEFVLR